MIREKREATPHSLPRLIKIHKHPELFEPLQKNNVKSLLIPEK